MTRSQQEVVVETMRELILAAESFRTAASGRLGLGLTDSQAISYLLARGALGQSELATALGVTTGSITVLVDRLERRGYVQRAQHPTDRRRSIVRLTPEGNDTFRDASEWLAEAATGIPQSELAHAIDVMRMLAEGLRQRAAAATRDGKSPAGS